MIGTMIATLGPVPMFFGMTMVNFMLFIGIISFAEALYSPMINVFTFNFTKAGREGTFLTLTAAPTYFTMALTGIVGGFLLENYYPVQEDATHKKQPNIIWVVIIAISGVSSLLLYLGRDFFNVKEEEPKHAVEEIIDQDEEHLIKKKEEYESFDMSNKTRSKTIAYTNTRGSFGNKKETDLKLD